jgi:hypothetical protein
LPDTELARLISEQAADDTHRVYRNGAVSLDAVADLLGYDEDGLVSFLRSPALASQVRIAHGTRYGYVKQRCRCGDCRAVNALYQRVRRESARLHLSPVMRRALLRALVEYLDR